MITATSFRFTEPAPRPEVPQEEFGLCLVESAHRGGNRCRQQCASCVTLERDADPVDAGGEAAPV